MGLLSDFFIASESPVPNYNGGERWGDLDKCQLKHLSPLQAGQFLAILRGQDYVVDLIFEFELVTPEDADDWTMVVPKDMVEKLAAVQVNQIVGLAEQFARVTNEELGWSPDDFIPVVTELTALARRAIENNKSMFLWNCV